jgi:hypothetical protein
MGVGQLWVNGREDIARDGARGLGGGEDRELGGAAEVDCVGHAHRRLAAFGRAGVDGQRIP